MATATAQIAAEGPDLVEDFRVSMLEYAPRVLRIQTKAATVLPLDANRAQRIVEDKINAQLDALGYIRALILKARQEGISTWVGARIYRGTTLWSNRNALVLGDSDERAGILYRIYDRFHASVPDPAFRPGTRVSKRGQELLFTHDSQISVATAGGRNPGRAMTRYYLHLSELAFWQSQIETLTGVLQTVPHGMGEVYIESTANGMGDEFHTRWIQAVEGESDWLAIFLPWWIHEEYTLSVPPEMRSEIEATSDPIEREALDLGIEWESEFWKLTPEQLAWRRWKIANDFGGDARTFRQEFPATADEAFLVSGNAFFDEEALLTMRKLAQPPKLRANLLLHQGTPLIRAAERGWVRVWEMPDALGHYVIGADTAEGRLAAARDTGLSDPDSERGGRDYCSADVLKVGSWVQDKATEAWRYEPCQRQVLQIHGHMAPEVLAEYIYVAGMLWSCKAHATQRGAREPALVAVERNHSSGQTTLRRLKELGYPRLFWHRQMNVRTDRPTQALGWVTDGTTRMPMLDALATEVRGSRLWIPSADTVRELTTFVRGDDGRPEGQEGTHDDRVISLAIALEMARRHSHAAPYVEEAVDRADTPTGL